MDMSRYEFNCQKALHQGLQYARSLGHQVLEVEHVALALLRAGNVELQGSLSSGLKHKLERHLARAPRIFGSVKVGFGQRLNMALDKMEKLSPSAPVQEALFWEELARQSTVIQMNLARAKSDVVGSKETAQTTQRVVGDSVLDTNLGEESVKNEDGTVIPEKIDKKLREFTVDLSAMAETGELDPVIGRDMEVRRILEILGRKKKNNPLLIGEPGVGKSAIAEAIAIRIAEGNAPETMRGKRVLSLDLGSMLAGAKYRGEFEQRMKDLLEALKELEGRIILFIDEIHMLVGAGNQEGGADAANLLKPALARGQIQCLGATTLAEFRKYIEKDAALERRFQPLTVEEPDAPTALAILRGIKSRYEIHHGVKIDDEALDAAVNLSIQFLTSRRLPDKAIDLIDEAASRMRIQIDSVPQILEELKTHIHQVSIERQAIGNVPEKKVTLATLDSRLDQTKSEYVKIEAVWRQHQKLLNQMKMCEKKREESIVLYENAKTRGDFDFAAKLQYEEIPKIDLHLAQINEELVFLQQDHVFLRQAVGSREIAEIVSTWSKIPVGRLLEDDNKKLLSMEVRLQRRVYGQDDAVSKVAKAVKRARVGVNDPNRPLGVFLFLGPTGVGKTETAKALAQEMFSDESKMIRIDMSEFMEQHNASRLVGSPPGYVGHGEGGELTEAIRRKPFSVVLLDEVEKAHPRVLDIMLQMFDDGRLTDGKGLTIDCRNTLIIMTSNLALDTQVIPEEANEHEVRDALTQHLRPEFVNRIDEVVVFKRLGNRHLESLVDRLQEELNERLADRQMRVVVGERIRQHLIGEGSSGQFGGRAVRRSFQSIVVDAVSDRILTSPGEASGAWRVDYDEDMGFKWVEEYTPEFYLPPAD